ncbi:hypothetical protein Tcan_07359 [Toxocara canis]|uniref:Uncharacterized protein n=1 Tax=Toxocara canis TaxID=6265 RepID=A0A0B2V1L2_TOXCA|nr:hypothetical protein Tcan_07359 [Toxocara canis]
MLLGEFFKPFGGFSLAVRYNCPWHRNNFRPCYFPFKMKLKLKKQTVDARLKTRGGRLILMRRLLKEDHFLAWNHPGTPPERRLSYPL